MRKIAAVAAAAVLAFALAGCGSQAASSSSASSSSASASEAASSSSSSAVSQTASTVKFTEVKSADEAAKGAKISKFGVFDKITLDGAEFKNPKFGYADGVAQATYESGAIDLIVRKADGKHTAPLTDRDKTQFANTWTKSYEGLDVACYGAAKGAATVINWTDGTAEYGVTYQGLGGEEVTLDSDEVGAIVKAMKQANAKEEPKKEEAKEEQKQEENPEGEIGDSGKDALNGMDPEAIIWQQGLGEVISTTQVQLNDGKWYWEVTTRGSDGREQTYVIGVDGSITNVSGDQEDNGNPDGEIGDSGADVLDGMDPEAIIQQQGLGEVVSTTQVQLNDGKWYWQVTTRGSDGNEATYVIDVNGNVSQV